MDENNKNHPENGVPSGFDEVSNITPKPNEFKPTPIFSGFNGQKNEGFTVTPSGNYYTKPDENTPQPIAPVTPAASATPKAENADDTPQNDVYSQKASSLNSQPESTMFSSSPAEPKPETLITPAKPEDANVTPTFPDVSPVPANANPAANTDSTTPPMSPAKPKTVPNFIPNGTYSYSATSPVDTAKQSSANGAGQNVNLYSAAYGQKGTDTSMPQGNPISDKNKKKQAKKKYGLGVLITAIVLSTVLAVGGTFGGKWLYDNVLFKAENDITINKSANAIKQEVATIEVEDETVYSVVEAVAKKAGSSVVGIRSTAAIYDFINGNSETAEEGSGIIYTVDGYIITNYHVVQSSVESSNSKIEVFLPDDAKTAIPATVIGYDISSDLAIIKIEKSGLPAIEFADSDALTVGQYAIAIGNPGGLEFMGSVSCGVISGLNRSIPLNGSTMALIQTDAAINPGNSGGALVNKEGKLIGVNSIKLVDESYEGMGFAIPSNTVEEICDNIIKKQNKPTPYVGIQISTQFTAEQLRSMGLPAGAVVLSVANGGPAQESGIQRGDIITEFNGVTITSYSDLYSAIGSCTPGTSVTVKIYRQGRSYSTNVNVEANNAG